MNNEEEGEMYNNKNKNISNNEEDINRNRNRNNKGKEKQEEEEVEVEEYDLSLSLSSYPRRPSPPLQQYQDLLSSSPPLLQEQDFLSQLQLPIHRPLYIRQPQPLPLLQDLLPPPHTLQFSQTIPIYLQPPPISLDKYLLSVSHPPPISLDKYLLSVSHPPPLPPMVSNNPSSSSSSIVVHPHHSAGGNLNVEQVKGLTIPVPFQWATHIRAHVYTLHKLVSKDLISIYGDVQCKSCKETCSITFNLQENFVEIGSFIVQNKSKMHDLAPTVWMDPKLPTCAHCLKENSMNPVISSKKRTINWLFLLLGKMLGCCTLKQLKYFCKHSGYKCDGTKDQLLYRTYLGLCKQLDPNGPFDR